MEDVGDRYVKYNRDFKPGEIWRPAKPNLGLLGHKVCFGQLLNLAGCCVLVDKLLMSDDILSSFTL